MYDPIKQITNLSMKLDHAKEECMEILSCNERTLRYYIYEKKSLHPTRIGRTNMVKESELKRFIDSQTRYS